MNPRPPRYFFHDYYPPQITCGPQVILLSATMPADVLEVTQKFMRDPIRILVKKEQLTLEGETSLGGSMFLCVCVCVCVCLRIQ